MSAELGAWLRQQRENRGWTRPDMARRLSKAGHAKGDHSMPGLDSMCHNIYRWERGADGLSDRYKLLYCQLFDIPPDHFGPQPQNTLALATAPALPAATLATGDPYPRPELADQSLLQPTAVAYRGRHGPEMGDSTVQREVLMAAHQGSDHAQGAERRDIGDTTLEQLRADIVRLSVESMTGEPFPLFLEMRRVRERIFGLLDQQLWPRDQTELYFLVACLSDLMAVAASGLGYPQAAEELLRSGWAYATVIDHHPLLAHLRLQLASVLYWQQQPGRARDAAEDGLRYLAVGPNGAHLQIKYARAAARLGDAEGTRRAISAASDARDADYHDDLLDIGGEFGLSSATEHYFAGSALADLPGAEREAADELERAVSLYDRGPEPGEEHWFAGRALTGIDLAAIRLRSGALDAAITTLEPVLALPPAQRINALTTRLGMVRTELATPIFRGSVPARELQEQIEEYGRETMNAGLHSLSGGSG